MIPRQHGEPIARWRDSWADRPHYLSAGAWPTVDETADALAMMAADTVLQILHGQALSYGLGAASEPPVYTPDSKRAKQRAATARYKARRRRGLVGE